MLTVCSLQPCTYLWLESEGSTSPISEQVTALHVLQNLVWTEAVNVRGKSRAKTREALKVVGLPKDARLLAEVMRDRDTWQRCCMDLFLGLKKEMDSRGQLKKLRFLQYTMGQEIVFDSFFRSAEGTVCLGWGSSRQGGITPPCPLWERDPVPA